MHKRNTTSCTRKPSIPKVQLLATRLFLKDLAPLAPFSWRVWHFEKETKSVCTYYFLCMILCLASLVYCTCSNAACCAASSRSARRPFHIALRMIKAPMKSANAIIAKLVFFKTLTRVSFSVCITPNFAR